MRHVTDRCSGALCCGLALLLVLAASAPARGSQWRRGLRLTLVEYSDPAYARRGSLTELLYTGTTPPPYGYAYAVRMKIGRICRRRTVALAGGRVLGWVADYDYGDPGTFPQDLYADAVAIVPYGSARNDGSSGRDLLCGRRKEERTGTLRVYRRAETYWYVDNGYYHVVDVLDCSDQLGCQWYAGYSRGRPQGGVGPDRVR